MTKNIIRGRKGTLNVICQVTSSFTKKYKAQASLSKYNYNFRKTLEAAKYSCIVLHAKDGGTSTPSVQLLEYWINYIGDTEQKYVVKDNRDRLVLDRFGNPIIRKRKVDGFLKIKRESLKIKSKRVNVDGKYLTQKYYIDPKTNQKYVIDESKWNKGDIKMMRKKSKKSKGKYYSVVRDVRSDIIIDTQKWEYNKTQRFDDF